MKKLFLSLFVFSTLVTFSQQKGVVVDSKGEPMNDVDVFCADQNILLKTNKEGIFLINTSLPNNSYIHFHKQGYASQVIKYKDEVLLEVVLEKLHVSLDEVGVTESVSELGNSRLTNIEKKSIKDVFLTSNSMLENITNISGVDIISSGLGIQKTVVRGLSGMRVVSYINGMQINNQQWANDHGIGFTDLGLGEVELIKGASALKYGSEAIGGLLYFKDSPFITNENAKGFVATKFNNSSYLSSSQFGIKWNKNNLHINLYGQYSISSDYRLPNGDYLFASRFMQNSVKLSLAYRYNNFQNIFRYQFHNEATAIPAHIHGDPADIDLIDVTSSSLNLPQDYDTTRPTQYIYNQLFIYESSYMKGNFKYSVHAGHFINNLQEWEAWTRPNIDLILTNTQLTPNIRYKDDYITLNLGAQIILSENKNGNIKRLIPDASSLNVGSYLIVDYERNNIGFNAGIRDDYKSLVSQDPMLLEDYDNNFYNTSFSTGLYYQLIDHVFRISYSGAYRAPHISELFSNGLHHGTNRYEIGNRDLSIEYADQFDFKYQWSNQHLGFVINPFVQYISNFISISPTDTFEQGYKVYNYIQYDKVAIKGIEMNLHYHPHQLHNLHFEQSYSFLQTKNIDSEYGLALTPANSIKTKVLFDFNEYENLVRYNLDYISFNHIHKFSQESISEFEEFTSSYDVFNVQLGLRISDQFHCMIGVNNLLNQEYVPHISRLRGVAGGVPHPGRFTNINLKYEF